MKLSVTFSPQSLSVKATAPSISVKTADQIAEVYVERDPYTGPYTITPGAEAVTVPVIGKRMTANLVVEPVPSNYGLITWNGSTLTVS